MSTGSYLSSAAIEEFRQILLDQRRQVEESVKALTLEVADESRPEAQGGGLSNMPTHPADMGTDAYQRELSLSLQARQQRRLAEIDDALARIDEGAYGVCLGTGQTISKERLRAKPWARYSLDFERQMERH